MDVTDTLGVQAHPGGMLVDRPELTVGLLRATSSPTGLEVELVARMPPDRRTAQQRQADIRAGRDGSTVAARRLLPAYDEGVDLRFGLLDEFGRARWSYPKRTDSSDDRTGRRLRAVFDLPPMFDGASFVLAWPEIGFPETVVHLTLPDRATVERGTVRIWQAPATATSAPGAGLRHRDVPTALPEVEAERGRSVAAPRLLHRAEDAVVVLTRLTAVGPVLSMEIRSAARGDVAGRIAARAFPMQDLESEPSRQATTVAVVDGAEAMRLRPHEATASGGRDMFEDSSEYTLRRPGGDTLDLIVGWPAAGLPDVHVTVPLTPAPD